jgi:hypothetical protein
MWWIRLDIINRFESKKSDKFFWANVKKKFFFRKNLFSIFFLPGLVLRARRTTYKPLSSNRMWKKCTFFEQKYSRKKNISCFFSLGVGSKKVVGVVAKAVEINLLSFFCICGMLLLLLGLVIVCSNSIVIILKPNSPILVCSLLIVV